MSCEGLATDIKHGRERAQRAAPIGISAEPATGQTPTCSETELLYFLDILFLMVSFTDFTFFPREMREAVGDLIMSLYTKSPSLPCNTKQHERLESRMAKPRTKILLPDPLTSWLSEKY